MRIGITNTAYCSYQKGSIDYEKMHAHGYSCADYQNLMDTRDGLLFHVDRMTFEKLLTAERRQANDAGIEFSQVHAPWPTDDLTAESRREKFEYMKSALEGCALLGSKYFVVHPVMPFGWGKDEDPDFTLECNADFLIALCVYGGDLGVNICIENMPFPAYRLSRIPSLVKFVKSLHLKNLFICFDTGHANVFGDDCGKMIRMCGDLLKVLHVHDNNGKQDEHRMPFEGTIDWESFRMALKKIRYDGCISLETSVSRRYPEELYEYMQKGLAMTAKYLAQF